MTVESQIHADIEALRKNAPDTQALYREVCAMLFFRYGITPTTNKLYHYVRKGSMSAPAEALTKFWEDLREKSRVRIEHPELPNAVKSAAGDLVASLWGQAQAAAKDGLDAFRSEAQTAVLEVQAEITASNKELLKVRDELNQAHQNLQTQMDRILVLEREVSSERAGKEALASQLEASGRQQNILEGSLADARRDFAAELEKLRHALQRSEDRCEATEKRALLEIDRERTVAAKYQKELAHAQRVSQEFEERLRAEVARLQNELGDSRQKHGLAEGSLLELRAGNLRNAEQLQLLGAELAKSETETTFLRKELELCRSNVTSLTEKLQQVCAVAPVKDGERKTRKIKKTGAE